MHGTNGKRSEHYMTAYTSMHFRCHERLEARLVSLPRRRRALGQILRAFMATRWSEGCCYSCVAFFSMRPVRCSPRPPAKHEELKEESEGLTEPLPEKPSSVHSFNPFAPVFNPGALMHYFDIDWRVPASPDLDLYWLAILGTLAAARLQSKSKASPPSSADGFNRGRVC